MINNIERCINGIKVCIDSKVELIGILITLSDESSIEPFKRLFKFEDNNSEYINIIKKEFSYLYETGLIERFNIIKNKYYIHYQEPIKLMLMLDDNFNTNILKEYCGYKPDKDFYEIIDEIKELYKSDRYINFYNSNISYYNDCIDSLIPFYTEYNLKNIICEYCGDKYNNLEFYNLLIPFETNGGYGIILDTKAYYCSRINTNNLFFYPQDKNDKVKITLHEFLHSIINPMIDKYNFFTKESNYLEKTDNLKFMGYGSDNSIINETIVRAVTIRIYSLLVNNINTDELVEKEYNQGFIYIKEITEFLLEYENNKIDFDSIFEKIINKYNNIELTN